MTTSPSEIDRLVGNLNKRAKLPRGFSFWSLKLQVMWLRAHQKRKKEK